jgi:hypothetical protein
MKLEVQSLVGGGDTGSCREVEVQGLVGSWGHRVW